MSNAKSRTDPGVADEVASEILQDLRCRSGLGNAWDEIDAGIREEIRDEWRRIILRSVSEGQCPQQQGMQTETSERGVAERDAKDLLRASKQEDEDYQKCLNRVAELVELDPALRSRDGIELEYLATAIELYEKLKFPM